MDPSEPTKLTAAPEQGRPLPPPQPPSWRLVRARQHVLAGVCQGVSVATGVDATLVRLAFIAVGLTGVGILAYIVLALLLPREDPAAGRPLVPAPPDTARWLRVALLVAPILSLIGLINRPWRGSFFPFGFWPAGRGAGLGLLLIAVGVVVIWLRRREDRDGDPANAAAPAWWQTRPQTEPATPPATARPDTTPTAPAPASAPATARPPRHTALTVARVFAWLAVIGAVLAAAATIWLERIGALSVPKPFALLAVGVGAVALVIAAAIWARSAMPVLAAMASLAVPLVLVLSLGSWNGGVGDRLMTPTALGSSQDYHLAVGRLTLDLTQAPLDGRDAAVHAANKIGVLEVLVPSDAVVAVDAHVGAGQSRIFGRERSGLGVSDHTVDTPAAPSGTLRLDLDVAVGQLTVCRLPAASLPFELGCEGLLGRR